MQEATRAETAGMATPAGAGGSFQDERTWALFTHLSALAAVVTGGIGAVAGPLVVWLIGREKHASVDAHGKEAVNFNITILIVWVALTLVWVILAMVLFVGVFAVNPFALAFVPFVVFGFFIFGLIAVVIFWLVQVIMASVKAANGEPFRYAFSFRFIK